MDSLTSNPDYFNWLKEIKTKIANVRVKAARAANLELIQLYWYLGNQITGKQKGSSWVAVLLISLAKT